MTNQPLDPHQQRLFAAWCTVALGKMPYMAPTLYALRPVATTDTPYAAVDNHGRLYLNFDGINRHGVTFGGEALLHECSHILADHFRIASTLGAQGTQEWAKAADLAINDDLVAAGCATIDAIGITPGTYGLPDWQTPHWYYAQLQKQQPERGPGPGQGQDGDQEAGQDAGSPDGTQGQHDSRAAAPAGGQQPPQPPAGTDAASASSASSPRPHTSATSADTSRNAAQRPFGGAPDSSCGTGAGGTPMPGELDPNDDFAGTAPAADPGEIDLAREATAARIVEHHKARGNVPGSLVRYAEEILAPDPIPWRTLITRRIVKTVHRWRSNGTHSDWSRRSRRHSNATITRADGPARVFMPATREPAPSIAVVIDDSGSMSPTDLGHVVAHVEQVSAQLGVRGSNLKMVYVDAAVHAVRNYTGRASARKMGGGGGTDMRVGIRHVWDMPHRTRPAICVVLTDGGTPWPNEPGPVPVVAGIIGPREYATMSAAAVPDWIHSVVIGTD